MARDNPAEGEYINTPEPTGNCVTHHFACRCREEQMDRMRRALELIRDRNVKSRPGYEAYRHGEAMGMAVLAQVVLEGGDPDEFRDGHDDDEVVS